MIRRKKDAWEKLKSGLFVPAPLGFASNHHCCHCGKNCGECCNFTAGVPAEMIVDLGAGGWTDGFCDCCDEAAGEFTLDSAEASAACCEWNYLDEDACDCTWGIRDFGIDLTIVDKGGGNWAYDAKVYANTLPGVGVPAAWAYYESDETDSTDCLELVNEAGKTPLTKYDETAATGCAGALPETIYTWVAP